MTLLRAKRRHEQLALEVLTGSDIATVAEVYGVSQELVRKAVRQYRIDNNMPLPTPKPPPPGADWAPKPERDAEIFRMRFFENMTLQEIATKFGITRERVRQIADREAKKTFRYQTL